MIFLPGLAVVFAGLLGGKGDVDKQLKAIIRELHVKSIALPAPALHTLTHHGDGTRELVRKLHVDGVIGCEVITGHGAPSLRLVIYDHDGGLKTYTEVMIGAHGLTQDDLDVLRSNLQDDVAELGGAAPEPAPTKVAEPEPPKLAKPEPPAAKIAKPEPPPAKVAKPEPPAAKIAKPEPPPAKIAKPEPPAAKIDDPEIEIDPIPTRPTRDDSEHATAAGDAVSADEIAALTAGEAAPAAPAVHTLHLGAAAGIGIASRAFNPSPSTVTGYASSPVAALVVEAHVQPIAHTSLSVSTERTLQLTTPMRDGRSAATTISRWQAGATYALLRRSTFELGPYLGAGRRAFSIDSADAARSPDGDYNYAIVGVAAMAQLGERLALHGNASFEPVIFGTEPTEMAFGDAARWALDIGVAVEVRPWSHVFARVAAQYQRFTWSWNMAGARGAGGAVDEYPSGAISIGADY